MRGGRVLLRDAGRALGFDLAFRNPHPRTEPPARHDPAPIDLSHLDATGLALFADVHGVPTIAVTHLRSIVHVWIPYPGGPTRLQANDLAGHVAIRTPIPVSLAISSGAMRYDSDARERANVDLQGVIDDVHVRWTNSVVQRGHGVHVASTLVVPDALGALREAPLIAQASAAELISSGFDFSLQIGPTERRRTGR